VFGISLIQNVIRYKHHASYDIWTSVIYLAVSVLLFIPFMILSFHLQKGLSVRFNKWYWPMVVLLALVILLIFYLLSGILLHSLEFFDHFISEDYARYYFGREALYHLLVIFGSSLFVRLKGTKKRTTIEVSKGRKTITLRLDAVHWIEADDHYLNFYTKTDVFIKRASLGSMTKQLAPDFIRIHRKYVVNKSQIVSKEKKQREEFVLLSSGKKLKVGQSFSPLSW
jgi:cellulose synthase/poly-beta-1,6-N-acetylglucosamine synthase-like glycosyltransferase